ncbi:MAG: hypothetical protein E7614_08585 [Ruminococcaceae bacterium]|nr:hypothetical protein [Oscillospiraceae bacterium]
MSEFFLTVLNMSISASWVVLAVLLLRIVLKKAPKWITVLLWGVVAVRLICPFSIESVMSLIPSAETISPNIMTEQTPQIHTGIPSFNSAINPIINESFSPSTEASANPLQIWISVLATVWIIGIIALLIYTAISYLRISRKVRTAVLLKENVYQSENVVSPFVLGIIKPKIYIPFNVSETDCIHVIAHEKAHIQRKDHFWKPFGFLVLTLHWFNPLMWLGYTLLCRDIELACDEKVVKELNVEQKADYSEALLTCSVNRRMISACPLAFGEVGVKNRVKTILNYKKPAFWIIVIAIIASVVFSVCFLTNPKTNEDTSSTPPQISIDPNASSTDYNGVYITIESIKTDSGGRNLFDVVWHNETDKQITYGESFALEYKSEEEWVEVDFDDSMVFHLIGILLNPNETKGRMYTTNRNYLTKKGTYRFVTHFTTEENGEQMQYKTWVEFEVNSISNVGESIEPIYSYFVSPEEIERLKAKFPMYFDLTADKGLEVYIWQMAEDSYRCGLLSGKNSIYTQEEIWQLQESSTSIDEMRVIIAHYRKSGLVNKSDVVIMPVSMPHSSYIYTIDDEYRKKVTELFWSQSYIIATSDFSPVIDIATFDIDGDGKDEKCVLSYGPTSGLSTFKLTAWGTEEKEKGIVKYFNIFLYNAGKLSFVQTENGMKLRIVEQMSLKAVDYSFSIKDGNVVLTSNNEDMWYWGEQGINSNHAPVGSQEDNIQKDESEDTSSDSEKSDEQTNPIFITQNASRITFYAYYGTGKGSDVPKEHFDEILSWLNSFTIEKKVSDDLLPPGTNTVYVEIEYSDGTAFKGGIDIATIDGVDYYIKGDSPPECYEEIMSKVSLF